MGSEMCIRDSFGTVVVFAARVVVVALNALAVGNVLTVPASDRHALFFACAGLGHDVADHSENFLQHLGPVFKRVVLRPEHALDVRLELVSALDEVREIRVLEWVLESPLQRVLRLADVLLREQVSRSCLLYTSPSPRDGLLSRMPSSA